ncbi:hypothetical protein VPH35_048861 [Triticum aestivum]
MVVTVAATGSDTAEPLHSTTFASRYVRDQLPRSVPSPPLLSSTHHASTPRGNRPPTTVPHHHHHPHATTRHQRTHRRCDTTTARPHPLFHQDTLDHSSGAESGSS